MQLNQLQERIVFLEKLGRRTKEIRGLAQLTLGTFVCNLIGEDDTVIEAVEFPADSWENATKTSLAVQNWLAGR
jgi:hypothetical protein